MTMGVDYPRYLRFEQLTPWIRGTVGDPLKPSYPDGYAPSRDDFEYCQQFIIEVALRVAGVNAELKPPSWLRQKP